MAYREVIYKGEKVKSLMNKLKEIESRGEELERFELTCVDKYEWRNK